MHYNCSASHTGDAWRGRGRERERGISSELARVVVVVLVVVLVRVVVVVVLVVVIAVVVVVVVVVVVFVVGVVGVVVIVVVAVAAWSCCRCRCYLCSWVLFANTRKSSNRRFLQTPKKRQIGGVFAIFHVLGTKNTVNTDVFGSAPTQNHGIYEVLSLC